MNSSRKPTANASFGAPYAVINLSKIGLRYFRFMINASPTSRERLISNFKNHPNVGWVFSASGWFNLALGVWAKDNSEINDINNSLRDVLDKEDEIVYESELTSLYSFGDRTVKGEKAAVMPIVDPVFSPVNLSSLQLDYIKLLTLDSSLPDNEMAEILSVNQTKLKELRSELESSGVIVGYQDRINYEGFYYKVFIDTLSAKQDGAVKDLTERLWVDTKCIYIERANGKYNFEFEIILEDQTIEDYIKDFSEYKIAILHENLYTNLYPLNKIANLKEIRDTISNQTGNIVDFRNSKLWYLNYDGAGSYIKIYDNEKYFELMNKSELDLFNDVALYIQKENRDSKYNVIDIGSGNGFKGRVFIEKLGEETVKAYYPVDIQPIELATALKAHEEGKYSKSPVLLDFANLSARFPLALQPHECQIYMLLGGTYGNFKNSLINSYLQPLVSDSQSIVLVSMPIRSESKNEEEIVQSYVGTNMQVMSFGPLSQLGFSLEDFELNKQHIDLRMQLAMQDDRVVTYYILDREKSVSGRTFEKGTIFKMTTSWKPTLQQVKDALAIDFTIKQIFSGQDMAIIALGKK